MHGAMHSVMLDRPDLTSVLPTIAVRTLFAVAEQDPNWPAAAARAAARAVPTAQVAVLAGAGHVAPLMQAPAAAAELIRAFWRAPAPLHTETS